MGHSSKWGGNVNALPNREGAPREALSGSFIVSNMRFVTFMGMCEILGIVYEATISHQRSSNIGER